LTLLIPLCMERPHLASQREAGALSW